MPAKPPAERAGAPTMAASPLTTNSTITIGVAALTWMCGWIGGNIVASAFVAASGHADATDQNRPVWVVVVSSVLLWIPQLAALAYVSRRFGSGRPTVDYAARFRPIDLVGIPVGVLSQLVLLRLVYWPLQDWWPSTFSSKQLEENARDLYDSASGVWIAVLVLVVVVGAPLVEELVYRGLLMEAARRRFNDGAALVGVAAFFALIHFRPVEYPGLFVFGLVLGTCLIVTNRIGMGIIAHLAFNATALALVAR